MSNQHETNLTSKDIELIESVMYKMNDDVMVAIARSFERMEDRIDAMESRMYARIAELEDRTEEDRRENDELFQELKEVVREEVRAITGKPVNE